MSLVIMKPISLVRLALCLARGSLEWWTDPRCRRLMLRNRAGILYRWNVKPGHYTLTRYHEKQPTTLSP